MNEMRPSRILHEMCDIVESELAHPMRISGQSYFADMLNTVEELDKRHFVQSYVSDVLRMLLLGVIDQARCMALVVDTPGIAVTPFILMRTLIEYGYKITYISDPHIEPEERIRRTLDLWYLDGTQYERLPEEMRSEEGYRLEQETKQYLKDWYRELTGQDLKKKHTKSILDAVWQAGLETWQENNEVPNDIYEKGYKLGSAFQHGNIWAIQHYCLDKQLEGKGIAMNLHLRPLNAVNLLRLAGTILQGSFGFVVQVVFFPPAGVINKLAVKIADLEKIRADILERKEAQSVQD